MLTAARATNDLSRLKQGPTVTDITLENPEEQVHWLLTRRGVSISQQSAGCETVTLPLHCTRLSLSSSEMYQRRPCFLPSDPSALLPPISHRRSPRFSTTCAEVRPDQRQRPSLGTRHPRRLYEAVKRQTLLVGARQEPHQPHGAHAH